MAAIFFDNGSHIIGNIPTRPGFVDYVMVEVSVLSHGKSSHDACYD
jgi:hypothetical protein